MNLGLLKDFGWDIELRTQIASDTVRELMARKTIVLADKRLLTVPG